NPAAAEIFSWSLAPGHILPIPAPWQSRPSALPCAFLRSAALLRRLKCDLAVCAWADARVSLLQKVSGIPRRVGFRMTATNYFAWQAALGPNRLGIGRWIERVGRVAGPGPLLTEELSRRDYWQPHHQSWTHLADALGVALGGSLAGGKPS